MASRAIRFILDGEIIELENSAQAEEWADCVNTTTRPCGTDTGECTVGIETCSGGTWSACQGAVLPQVETCDGLDNDCDGVTDDGDAVAGGSDIALCSDIIVMNEDARIGYPPSRVWGCPTTAMWVYRLGAEKAKQMLFTGDLVTGKRAEEM